jgi:hypothetical protein
MRTGARYPAVEDAPARTCLPIPVTAERLRSGHRVPSWPPCAFVATGLGTPFASLDVPVEPGGPTARYNTPRA